jgi:methylenetetrahydrofolate dehydrogenase (NADP+) / methenyltetrahydrofolate cyclohydrolase
MRVDGRSIAKSIYEELAPRYAALSYRAQLGIVVVGENPVIESFVRIKVRAAEKLGIDMRRISLPDTAREEEVTAAIRTLVGSCHAVIVQLPLPRSLDTTSMLSLVPNEKDVDALNPLVPEEDRMVHAPVALAAVEILKRQGVAPSGKRAVVVGKGRLVGAPAGWLLGRLGANVSFFTLQEGSIADLKDADIIVSGAGSPGMIKPEHLKPGVALVDAGTSEQGGKITGDAAPACEEIAAFITPVPGGVGPVAVAMIYHNLLTLLNA